MDWIISSFGDVERGYMAADIARIKCLIICLLVIIVPLIIYGSIIIKILKKSFDKTPDAPSFTEKPGSAIALKNLTKLADVVFFIVLTVISINIVTANLGGNSEARQQEIIAEYDALKEDNVNPETGKTILTQASQPGICAMIIEIWLESLLVKSPRSLLKHSHHISIGDTSSL